MISRYAKRAWHVPTAAAWWVLLGGGALMYVGYFRRFDSSTLVVYVAANCLWAGVYLVWCGTRQGVGDAVQSWLWVLLFFPKKPLTPEFDGYSASLLAQGLGLRGLDFGYFDVARLLCAAGIVVTLAVRVRSPARLAPRPVRMFIWAATAVLAVGITNIAATALGRGFDDGDDPLRMAVALVPVFEGVVVTVAAAAIAGHQKSRDVALDAILVCCLLLVVEYVLATLSLLPATVSYYSFNERGGFRSAWQSGDLFVGLLGMAGVMAALHLSAARSNRTWLLVAAAFLGLVGVTIDRACALGTLLAVVWFSRRQFAGKRFGVAAAFSALILVLLLGNVGLESIDRSAVGEWYHQKAGRHILDNVSSQMRLGAALRGLEVFVHYPILGCGPGMVGGCMSGLGVPRGAAVEMLGTEATSFYGMIVEGRPTNPHLLVVAMAAEFGLAGVALAIATLMLLIWGVAQPAGRRTIQSSVEAPDRLWPTTGTGILLGLVAFYLFHPAPQLWGLMGLAAGLFVMPPTEAQYERTRPRNTRRLFPTWQTAADSEITGGDSTPRYQRRPSWRRAARDKESRP